MSMVSHAIANSPPLEAAFLKEGLYHARQSMFEIFGSCKGSRYGNEQDGLGWKSKRSSSCPEMSDISLDLEDEHEHDNKKEDHSFCPIIVQVDDSDMIVTTHNEEPKQFFDKCTAAFSFIAALAKELCQDVWKYLKRNLLGIISIIGGVAGAIATVLFPPATILLLATAAITSTVAFIGGVCCLVIAK